MTEPALSACGGCGAEPGTDHGERCGHARCPECGEQLIGCGEHADSNRPARWRGIDQRAEVARRLDWWTTATGIDHLVEDYTRVLFAEVLGQIRWSPETQRYDIGQIDEAEIDEAGRKARPPYVR
jgi:hypothetical protein